MGVDTKLFVGTESRNIVEVMPKVIDSLNKWQREHFDRYWKEQGFDRRVEFLFRDKKKDTELGLKDYTNGIRSTETYDFSSFNIYFTIAGHNRRLFVIHTCGGDYKELYEGEKIIFSIGCWGMSKEIMMVVAEAVKEFGDVYFVHNDCEDDWEKLF